MKKNYLFIKTITLLLFFYNAYGQTETEPNNFFNTANTITLTDNAGSIQGAISTNGDADYYKVEITQAGVFVADITNIPQNIDIEYTLFDSRQNQIANWNNRFQGGKPLLATNLVCEAGTYFFRIRDYNNNSSSSESYKFKISLDVEDIFECNNTFPTAAVITLDENHFAKIRSKGDEDYYQVEIAQAGVFVADISNIPQNIDIEYTLFDSNRNIIANWNNRFQGGKPLLATNLVCEAGTYFFRIRDYDNNSSNSESYKFKISLDVGDTFECNNTFPTASTINLGEDNQAKIRAKGDEDYYKIEIIEPGVLIVDVSSIPQNIDIEYTLFDSRQNQIANWNNRFQGGKPLLATNLVCEVGIYFFRIRDSDNNNSSSEFYNFKISQDVQDIHECNNNFNTASPINLCETVNGAIFSTGDVDFFSFNTLADQQITIQLSNVASNIRPDITVYNESQNSIYNRSSATGTTFNGSFTPSSTGKYYIRIANRNNASNSQLYELLLEDASCTLSTYNFILNDFSIYPNPAKNNITIQLEENTSFKEAKIYSQLGQLINTSKNTDLDISKLSSGMYFIEVSTNKGKGVKQFIKK